MNKETYEKLANVTDINDVLSSRMSDLKTALDDAKNQCENNSGLGMAVAVGTACDIYNDIDNIIKSLIG